MDLTGQKFGRWTVLNLDSKDRYWHKLWLCKCECGTERIVNGDNLTRGLSVSCGCVQKEKTYPDMSEDLAGKRFGKIVVIKRVNSDIRPRWLYRCDCGREKEAFAHQLKKVRKDASCGCATKLKHGDNRRGKTSRLYRIWISMRRRCYSEEEVSYKRYGGRDITVCDSWRKFYLSFKKWALANGYKNNLSIDRVNNDGNYEPSNCRWATDQEQANNRRTNHNVTFKGTTKSIAEWAREFKIRPTVLHNRLFRYGWGIEEALCGKEVVSV